jgi:hypothetical protein
MFLKANWEHYGAMFILLIALVALVAILVALVRTLMADGYGLRPPPRSHRAEEEFDSWGFPLRHLTPR